MESMAARRSLVRGSAPNETRGSVVLLVTDDPELQASAWRGLSDEGYEVVTAAHAGHALLACLAGKRFDVLVIELAMQDMAGPQVARSVHRYYPRLPVVYLAPAGTPERGGVIVRPFTGHDLARELTTTLAGLTA